MSEIETFVGFDSAWTDSVKAPGAICAVAFRNGVPQSLIEPRLVRFDAALTFIQDLASRSDYTLVALDQPTIVPNQSSLRPVERVAGSVIGWIGGGVQPSNRGKKGMFCDDSPIWGFLAALGASEDPEVARTSRSGLHLIEVFPALALPALEPEFFRYRGAPRYNPGNSRRFNVEHWGRVAATAGLWFEHDGLDDAAHWCRGIAAMPEPKKADQDRLDAMLCLLISLRWRRHSRESSMMLGDLENGYMVVPATPQTRARLEAAGTRRGVPIDGAVPPGRN